MTRIASSPILVVSLWAITTAWNWAGFDPRAEALRNYQARFVVLPRADIARAASLGFRSVASDLYWIAAVNYFGDQRNDQVSYAELYNHLELVVSLDPDFEYPYLFGGISLPWNTGKGWLNIDEAISLLERGVKRFPDSWRLRFQLAYTYSTFRDRFKDAGDQLAAVALLPGSPDYVGRLATRMYATAGQYDAAMMLAEHLASSIDDPKVKGRLLRRAAEARTVREVLRLEELVKRFFEVHHHFPAALGDLVSAGFLSSLPVDELGGTFEYNSATGEVQSSMLHDRLRIHR